MPKILITALRKSFATMVKDPKFIAVAEKRGLKVQPKTGEEVQAIVEGVMEISPEVVKRAQKLILGSGKGKTKGKG